MRALRMSAAVLLAGGMMAASIVGATAAIADVTPTAADVVATSSTVTYQTRVPSFSVPARHEIHSLFTISGTVQKLSGSAWTAAASVEVYYYFRMLPSGTWKYAGRAPTNSNGIFKTSFRPIRLGWVRWQVRVPRQQHGDNIYLASSSGTHDSFFTDRTYVAHFVALHLSGTTALGAIVQDYPPSGGVSYTTPQGTAKFYYHPRGSTTWHYLGSSRTDSQGSVSFEGGGLLHGYFRIVFPAQGDFLGSTSNTLYLS